jgi:hypothetical protein
VRPESVPKLGVASEHRPSARYAAAAYMDSDPTFPRVRPQTLGRSGQMMPGLMLLTGTAASGCPRTSLQPLEAELPRPGEHLSSWCRCYLPCRCLDRWGIRNRTLGWAGLASGKTQRRGLERSRFPSPRTTCGWSEVEESITSPAPDTSVRFPVGELFRVVPVVATGLLRRWWCWSGWRTRRRRRGTATLAVAASDDAGAVRQYAGAATAEEEPAASLQLGDKPGAVSRRNGGHPGGPQPSAKTTLSGRC